MNFERSSGILLHITSLPSNYGIGDLGASAYQFVDFLIASDQKLWQVLPLGHTGFGDSPYQSFSAFAGNPLLISPDELLQKGLLSIEDIEDMPNFDKDYVEYGKVIEYKYMLYKIAFRNFKTTLSAVEKKKFKRFCSSNQRWLDHYALFMALKDHFGGRVWSSWSEDIKGRKVEAVEKYEKLLRNEIDFYKFLQYVFHDQWYELKAYANRNGIQIIGDIPIFVAYDSADVWANREMFYLDVKGFPTSVAGVPPDFFSETGQLWGNPLYDWEKIKNDGYAWWIDRFKSSLKLYDIIRIDHFRGFAAYWSIPYGEETAINGKWIEGPGADLFYEIEEKLGKLPIIAEDLGVITEDVVELRDEFHFPGMNILQYAFSEGDSAYLPHNNIKNSVVYTGTHDNDTSWACFKEMSEAEREKARSYMNSSSEDAAISWDFIRAAFSSPAVFAIIPLQDYLCLGSEGRMNKPGEVGHSWRWRYREATLKADMGEKISGLARLFGRI